MTHKRWWFAAAAFALGVVYTTVLAVAGVEVRLGGRDVALPVAAATELLLGIFGFALGRSVEARAAQRRASALERDSLEKLAALQSRLLHVEKLATVGQLASRIAHEVRNPLAIIRSTIQNLSETGAPRDGELCQTCAQVLDEIDRLSRVTTSLVGLSRPPELRLGAVDVSELLSRVEWLARRLLEGRGIWVRVAPQGRSPEAPIVRADPDLACQVLLGLVSNAADAAPGESTIELGFREDRHEVVFEVRDAGPGVPTEIRERIFDPFFTTKPEGSGLGLAVARDFAEAQGGLLVLEETDGLGAAFAFHLPRASKP